jgi:hypothetical protein
LKRNCGEAAVLLVLCLFISVFPSLVQASGQTDAASELEVAKIQLINAYISVQQAEEAGANITELAVTLNQAGSLFSQAEQAYSKGDFATSQNLSAQIQGKLGNLSDSADILKEAVTQQKADDLWIKLLYPIFGSIAIIVVAIAVWFVLKRKYSALGVMMNLNDIK